MKALRRAFPKSVVMQYANFMPGEWLPGEDRGHLRAVYKAAKGLKVGVGGPDPLPFRRGQLNHSYPLIRDASGVRPHGGRGPGRESGGAQPEGRPARHRRRTLQVRDGVPEG